ncbi:unnamed protein product [Blepharisma stoltei]|uniref:EF-hand domain-containing protein n=1 Tax=Blepharisma stoltei TaxID=1481888 RepID=A0AAU9KD39_9CILI|nr:unnamed protein product [Blepharisma stoltei]
MTSSSSSWDSDEDFSDEDLDIGEGDGVAAVSQSSPSQKPVEQSLSKTPIQAEPQALTEVQKDPEPNAKPSSPKPIETPKRKEKRLFSTSSSRVSYDSVTIPILNKDTLNRETYDLDMLFDPKVQGEAFKTLGIKKKFVNLNKLEEDGSTAIKNESGKRLLSFQNKYINDIEKNRQDLAKSEMEQCTFIPKINPNPAKNRSYDDFYLDSKKYLDEKMNKIKKVQEENEEQFKRTSEHWFNISWHESKLPWTPSFRKSTSTDEFEEKRHEKLYNLKPKETVGNQSSSKDKSFSSSQISESTDDSQVLFKPTVNKRSKEMVRDEEISDHLYNDAVRRLNKSLTMPLKLKTKIISDNSEQVLMDKLKREFDEKWKLVDIDDSNAVNYNRMLEVFRLMHFLPENKNEDEARLVALSLWKTLEKSVESVTKDSLFVVINAVMNFYQPWMEDRKNFPARINLSQSQAQNIHIKSAILYKNRNEIVNHSNLNQTFKQSFEYSFKPEISQNSQKYALKAKNKSKARDSISLSNDLYLERQKLLDKQAELKQKFDALELEKCTFNPKVLPLPKIYEEAQKSDHQNLYKEYKEKVAAEHIDKNIALYKFAPIATIHREKIQKPIEDQEIEKNKAEFTFRPKLFEREENDTIPEEQPGVKEAIERMKIGRENRDTVKKLKSRGLTMTTSQLFKSYSISTIEFDREMSL